MKKNNPDREVARNPKVPDLSEAKIAQITSEVFVMPNPHPADIIFVFGSSGGDWQLVADLYAAELANLIVVTGKTGRHFSKTGQPLAHMIREKLILKGVPAEAMLVQDKSTNTLEDVKFSKQILDDLGLHPRAILFVSKSHHSGRAERTLKKYFPQAEIFSATYNTSYEGIKVARHTWSRHEISRQRVYGEWLRIQKYSERGDI
ncbi:hypothetical protein CL634_04585 [bacterium]|nr:hypothetical protein [bacterium]|tara:strand:- start:977 stop:1588 length:612 start_codon:yes stop_codon:yes gene_type:complete